MPNSVASKFIGKRSSLVNGASVLKSLGNTAKNLPGKSLAKPKTVVGKVRQVRDSPKLVAEQGSTAICKLEKEDAGASDSLENSTCREAVFLQNLENLEPERDANLAFSDKGRKDKPSCSKGVVDCSDMGEDACGEPYRAVQEQGEADHSHKSEDGAVDGYKSTQDGGCDDIFRAGDTCTKRMLPKMAASQSSKLPKVKKYPGRGHKQQQIVAKPGVKQDVHTLKMGKIVPEELPVFPLLQSSKKRCGWITSQSGPAYVAYHDEEWGVPVHDDRKLFEMLVLVAAQAEVSWSNIFDRWEEYRTLFANFDPAVVAKFDDEKLQSLKAIVTMVHYEGKLQGIVENAAQVTKIVEEFGSFDKYLWGLVGNKTVRNNFRLPMQVPVKRPKSEQLSKALLKRGFRFVGPTIMYSFMQAVGMVNDHLVTCFRY